MQKIVDKDFKSSFSELKLALFQIFSKDYLKKIILFVWQQP